MPTFGAAWALAAAIISQQAAEDQKTVVVSSEKPSVVVEMPVLDPDQAANRRVRERALTDGDAQKYFETSRRLEASRQAQRQMDVEYQKVLDYRSGAYRARVLDAIKANDSRQLGEILTNAIPGAVADLEARFNALEPVVRSNQSELIKPFVEAGFSLRRPSPEDRYTLPMRAAMYGHVKTLKVMADLDLESLSVTTRAGSPLIVAALHGRMAAVKFLLHSGVPVPSLIPPLSQRVRDNGYHKIARLVAQYEELSTTPASSAPVQSVH